LISFHAFLVQTVLPLAPVSASLMLEWGVVYLHKDVLTLWFLNSFMLYINNKFPPHREQTPSPKQRPMLFWEVILNNCNNKNIYIYIYLYMYVCNTNTLCGYSADLLNVTAGSKYCYHCVLNVYMLQFQIYEVIFVLV
jgi:hypothetical protein